VKNTIAAAASIAKPHRSDTPPLVLIASGSPNVSQDAFV
jgi:hypothetical protein